MERAARVTSGVAHESTFGTYLGTGLGIAAVAAIGFFTGGIGIVAAIAIVGTANGVGHLADKYVLPEDTSEKIVQGYDHVFLDEEVLEAANASSDSLTDQHAEEVQTGSNTVYINNYPASRKTDRTKCSGVIVTGSPHIYYGGAPASDRAPGQHLPFAFRVFEIALGAAGLVTATNPSGAWNAVRSVNSLRSGAAVAWSGAKYASDAYGVATGIGNEVGLPAPQGLDDALGGPRDVIGAGGAIENLIQGGRALPGLFGR